MCFMINHSDLLQLIMEFCRITPSQVPLVKEIISKLNVGKWTMQKIRSELRSPSIGVASTSLDDLARFDFRGLYTPQTPVNFCCWLIDIRFAEANPQEIAHDYGGHGVCWTTDIHFCTSELTRVVFARVRCKAKDLCQSTWQSERQVFQRQHSLSVCLRQQAAGCVCSRRSIRPIGSRIFSQGLNEPLSNPCRGFQSELG